MGLEAATFINTLVPANPLSGDTKSQGDDHLRLIKAALQSTFPNANRAIYFQVRNDKAAGAGTIAVTEDNSIAVVNTSAGVANITLPAGLAPGDNWSIQICKISADNNPVFVHPPSGTLNGFAKIRLNIPGEVVTFLWINGFMRLTPHGQLPAGTHIEFAGDTVPPGFLAENGASLLVADYPELYNAIGYKYGGGGANFSLPNAVGTALVSIDGGSARVDLTNFGIAPTLVGNVGGVKSHVLTEAQLAVHSHANALVDPTHDHAVSSASVGIQSGDGGTGTGGKPVFGGSTTVSVDIAPASTGMSITNASTGGGAAHPNIQPSMISNRCLRAC